MNITRMFAYTGPLVCLLGAPSVAQDQNTLEEVVVFGTLVQRPDYVSPSPVFTISTEAIAGDGTPTLSSFLNKSPQFFPAFDNTSNNPGLGRGEADLRGLGSKRTLVLLNGKRLGPAGSDGAVDINVIPTALVDRVEVLTGGASAVYGSDAVSGAVNVVLKRDLDGFEIGGSYQVSDRGDADTLDGYAAGGFEFAGGRGKVTAFFSRTERDEVETAARDFSSQPLSEEFETGEVQEIGSPVSPSGWIPIPAVINNEFSANGLTFLDSGDPKAFDFLTDGYNYYSEFNYLQTDLKRDTAGIFTSFEFSESLSGYLDLTWASIETTQDIAPIPAFTFATINLDNPLLTPAAREVLANNYDPGGSGFFVGPYGIRLSQNGPRFSTYDRENYHLSLGLDGRFSNGWNWEASYTYTEHEADILRGNQISASRFDQSFLVDPATGQCFDTSNGCVGGDYYGAGKLSPELLAFLRAADLKDLEKSDQQIAQFIVRGDLALGSWRTASIALGAEYREDNSSYKVDPNAVGGDILSSGGAVAGDGGGFDVWELYLEAVLPLVEDAAWAREVLLDVGLRHSDYTSVGSAPSYKLGLNWEVVEGIRLRGMGQRAVRAPNVQELFSNSVTQISTSVLYGGFDGDPCSASLDPVGNGVADICVAQGLDADQLGIYEADAFYPRLEETTGNPDLEAEEADTFTVGFTWQPPYIEGFSLALDYYSIEIENAITSLQGDSLQMNCFDFDEPNGEFCQASRRDETGNVAYVRVAPLNVAELTSKGIDLQMEYRLQLPAVGSWDSSLSLSFIGNKTTEYGFRADPASASLDCSGSYGLPCNFTSTGSNPEYRTTSTVSYQVGSLVLNGIWRWIDSIENAGNKSSSLADAKLIDESGSQSYLDFNLSWEPLEHLTLRAGVTNATDEDPPLLGFNAQQNNTNPNLYDVLGKRYHLSLQFRF